MISYAKLNKFYKYLKTVINAFSKSAYAVPLKTKIGIELSAPVQYIVAANWMKYTQTG